MVWTGHLKHGTALMHELGGWKMRGVGGGIWEVRRQLATIGESKEEAMCTSGESPFSNESARLRTEEVRA